MRSHDEPTDSPVGCRGSVCPTAQHRGGLARCRPRVSGLRESPPASRDPVGLPRETFVGRGADPRRPRTKRRARRHGPAWPAGARRETEAKRGREPERSRGGNLMPPASPPRPSARQGQGAGSGLGEPCPASGLPELPGEGSAVEIQDGSRGGVTQIPSQHIPESGTAARLSGFFFLQSLAIYCRVYHTAGGDFLVKRETREARHDRNNQRDLKK